MGRSSCPSLKRASLIANSQLTDTRQLWPLCIYCGRNPCFLFSSGRKRKMVYTIVSEGHHRNKYNHPHSKTNEVKFFHFVFIFSPPFLFLLKILSENKTNVSQSFFTGQCLRIIVLNYDCNTHSTVSILLHPSLVTRVR